MKKGTNKLLIVGIILVIILLIFFTVMIIKTVLGNKLSDEEIEAFNNNFIKYEGSMNGTQVKDLLNAVISSNQRENEKRQIDLQSDTIKDTKGNTLILGEDNGKLVTLRNSEVINRNKLYKVSFGYASNGLINLIKIET